jgi:hypothetical protein
MSPLRLRFNEALTNIKGTIRERSNKSRHRVALRRWNIRNHLPGRADHRWKIIDRTVNVTDFQSLWPIAGICEIARRTLAISSSNENHVSRAWSLKLIPDTKTRRRVVISRLAWLPSFLFAASSSGLRMTYRPHHSGLVRVDKLARSSTTASALPANELYRSCLLHFR